ncbi:MAG TPA: hypothetical protein VJ603_05390 [Paucimonas sp.]|nr:hypothetical protein [Paucimonas sp.]
MPTGISPKREREFKQLQQQFRHDGRYKGREEEVAARIVNKQRSAYGETRQEKEKDKAGTSPDRHLPIQDYQTLTIVQIKGRLDALNGRDLKKLQAYEVRHKNRKGLLEILDRRIKRT